MGLGVIRAALFRAVRNTFHSRPAGIDHGTGPSDHRDDPFNHMTIEPSNDDQSIDRPWPMHQARRSRTISTSRRRAARSCSAAGCLADRKAGAFRREVIPERPHACQGFGAHGTFTVTHDITRYTKAKIFSQIGKQTQCSPASPPSQASAAPLTPSAISAASR